LVVDVDVSFSHNQWRIQGGAAVGHGPSLAWVPSKILDTCANKKWANDPNHLGFSSFQGEAQRRRVHYHAVPSARSSRLALDLGPSRLLILDLPLATMQTVTDRQTGRQNYDLHSRSYCVQYDRLKKKWFAIKFNGKHIRLRIATSIQWWSVANAEILMFFTGLCCGHYERPERQMTRSTNHATQYSAERDLPTMPAALSMHWILRPTTVYKCQFLMY